MPFGFFESLSASEARSLLEGFLETEAIAVEQTLAAARRQGLGTAFDIASLAPLMRWALEHLETVPTLADSSLPDWIVATDSYQRGLFDFTEPSKPIVLRIAFYLGECFVRNYPHLTWSVGNAETAEKNMPVVTGFGGRIEMAPMLVAKNLFRRVLSGGAKDEAFDGAVQAWIAAAERRT